MEQEEKEETWVVEFPLHFHFTITTKYFSLSFTAQIANNDNDKRHDRRSVLLKMLQEDLHASMYVGFAVRRSNSLRIAVHTRVRGVVSPFMG